MPRDEQVQAIWKGLDWLSLINDQFRTAIMDILSVAALAFDDDACLPPAQLETVQRLTPFTLSHAKGQLEHAIRDSGMSAGAAAEWTAALGAVYRIAGSDGIAPKYDGIF